MTENDFKAGERAAMLKVHNKQISELFDDVKDIRAWQNRAIGYIAAFTLVLNVLAEVLKMVRG